MGWIESPPYFCTVLETGWDAAKNYIDTPVGSLGPHKFVKLKEVNPEFAELPKIEISEDPFNYMLEVYIENCIELSIPRIRYQIHHVANAVMTGIHDMTPLEKYD